MNTRRSDAALVVPGMLAFAFVLLDSTQPIVERLTSAFVAGFVVETSALLGMFLMSGVAGWLCGERNDPALPKTKEFLAGALLFACLWIWWQYDRDEVVADVATCVEQMLTDAPEHKPHDAILACYRDRGDDDYRDADY